VLVPGVTSLTTRCVGIPARSCTVLWSACDQAMDVSINRKVAKAVPEHLRKIALPGGPVRLDTFTNTGRAVNMRFKYTSRRVRVPHIHPSYAR